MKSKNYREGACDLDRRLDAIQEAGLFARRSDQALVAADREIIYLAERQPMRLPQVSFTALITPGAFDA